MNKKIIERLYRLEARVDNLVFKLSKFMWQQHNTPLFKYGEEVIYSKDPGQPMKILNSTLGWQPVINCLGEISDYRFSYKYTLDTMTGTGSVICEVDETLINNVK